MNGEICDLYQKKGTRRMKCKEPEDIRYVWTDELGEVGPKGDVYDLAMCHEHIKLDPGPLNDLCKLTVQMQKGTAPAKQGP